MQVIGSITGVVSPDWGQPHSHEERVTHVQAAGGAANAPSAAQFLVLETEVSTKADQSDLDVTDALLLEKADQDELDTTNATATALANTVAAKADQTSLDLLRQWQDHCPTAATSPERLSGIDRHRY